MACSGGVATDSSFDLEKAFIDATREIQRAKERGFCVLDCCRKVVLYLEVVDSVLHSLQGKGLIQESSDLLSEDTIVRWLWAGCSLRVQSL